MPIHDWSKVSAGVFHDFHCAWIVELRNALNANVLPGGYYALAEQIAGEFGPEVLTLEATDFPESDTASSRHATALAEAAPRVSITQRAERNAYRAKQRTLVVRHSSGDRVVALLEIVSPGNKSGRHALFSLVSKAVTALDNGYHVLIADLFAPGPFDPQGMHGAIWSEMEQSGFDPPADRPLTLVSYCADVPVRAYVEPTALGASLPAMPLFLTPDSYVDVPLEATYVAALQGLPARWRRVLEGT